MHENTIIRKFKAKHDESWGFVIQDNPFQLKIEVGPWGQASHHGLRTNDIIMARNDVIVNDKNRDIIKNKLCEATQCKITFRREDKKITTWLSSVLPEYTVRDLCILQLKIEYYKVYQKKRRSQKFHCRQSRRVSQLPTKRLEKSGFGI